MGVPLFIIHFNRMFHHKSSSSWGTPIYGNLHVVLPSHEFLHVLVPISPTLSTRLGLQGTTGHVSKSLEIHLGTKKLGMVKKGGTEGYPWGGCWVSKVLQERDFRISQTSRLSSTLVDSRRLGKKMPAFSV